MFAIIKLESLKFEARCLDGGNYYNLRPLYFMNYMHALEWIGNGVLIWGMASGEDCNG